MRDLLPPVSTSLDLHIGDPATLYRRLEFVADAAKIISAATWEKVRAKVVAPVLRVVIVACLVMSVMLVLEAAFMALVSMAVKILRRKPEHRYKWEPVGGDGEKEGMGCYPMVLIQIPMFNEKEVYKFSIGAACGLTWPTDRLMIQVLDDSTDPLVKELVAVECKMWQSKGMNIAYEVRDSRKGYKAGALKKGMEQSYAQQCEFVAIFDADFRPDSDFLLKTIPFLLHNSKIALVQARWDFGEFLVLNTAFFPNSVFSWKNYVYESLPF